MSLNFMGFLSLNKGRSQTTWSGLTFRNRLSNGQWVPLFGLSAFNTNPISNELTTFFFLTIKPFPLDLTVMDFVT